MRRAVRRPHPHPSGARPPDNPNAMVTRHGLRCDDELRAVTAALGPPRAVAALLQISRFVTIALLCNAMQLELPVPSIFDAQPAT